MLRLAPAEFWTLTVTEFIAVANAAGPARAPMAARDLSRLMAAYPDKTVSRAKDIADDRQPRQ